MSTEIEDSSSRSGFPRQQYVKKLPQDRLQNETFNTQLLASRSHRSNSSSHRLTYLGSPGPPTGRCQLWPLLPLLLLLGLSPLPTLVNRASAAELTSCKIDNSGDLFVKQTHYFYHNHQSLDIVIEDSDRLSHRITNRILKILLESVAGYPQVKIQHCYSYDNQNITASLNRVSGRMVSKHCQPPQLNSDERIPDTMVNMEAWMVAGFNKAHWVDNSQLIDAGPLGPQGRMGWYLPTSVMEDFWNGKGNVLDHWRALMTMSLTREFSLWGDRDLEKLKPGYRLEAFKNNKCRGRRKNCATLFATYKGVDNGILEEQIETLRLYVDIVWLGEDLSEFVQQKVNQNKSVMFFNWHPNVLIATNKFTRINFPETYPNHKEERKDCDFRVNQLTKVLWDPIKSGAPEAYHIISKMSFTDSEYIQLVKMASLSYQSSSRSLLSTAPTQSPLTARMPASVQRSLAPTLDEVACKWVQDNSKRWESWLPQNLREKPKIFLGGLFPLSGIGWADMGLIAAANLALDMVNEETDVLPNYSLEMIVNDTQCKHDRAMGQFIAMHRRQPPMAGILGPGCSDAAERIASLSQHFHLLMVSYGAQARDMSDRNKYPYFFRTVSPVHLYRHVYSALFDKLGWQVVGTLTQSSPDLPEYHLSLISNLQQGKQLNSRYSSPLVVHHKVLNSTGMPDVAQVLREFKEQKMRIIIAEVTSDVARQIMCEAFKQSMTGYEGYVWFLPSWYPLHWQDVEFYNSKPSLHETVRPPYYARESVPCTTSQVERAAQGHFVLSQTNLAAPETRVAGGITVKKFQKMYAQRCADKNIKESMFASFVYDAVWVFANGLDVVLRQNKAALETFGTLANARALQAAIGNLSFSGVSGWIRFQAGHGNCITDLIIQQVFTNETRLVGQYKPVGAIGTETEDPLLQLDTAKIHWLSPVGAILDEFKSEEEDCFIEGIRAHLGVSCTIASVIVITLVFFLILIFAVILLLIIKYRCDTKMRKLKATHERMKELGLLSEEYSNLLAVDDWEIPLENIVLNRELGEGAFGAVMGGEMFKEREGWVAVAVKTLKVHHSVEEKLDFFSEVEKMKLLKHQNIVQLWGVCTRKQPMYAVMEFLLHGDLKTYLLSRRCLVGQGVKEAEDIKAENLTQMAVDIAQGLSYLHTLKYIHRDLACRNCLVHANKTVKIADFGLARHVSSTDYYRFSRKGMLPVRWTAPEALRDGIYSVKSDIWSYGVLVFEIVTFGSFPYQGLSNRQVVEEVVKGKQLKLPLQCNDALRSFIRWCMSADPGYRPDLSDILSYLAYSPAFLTPCIDAPITSVVHEDTDSMGDDSRVPGTLSRLLPSSVSSAPHPAVCPVSSNPHSTGTSISSALHQTHLTIQPTTGRVADSTEGHNGNLSFTRMKLHSSGAAGENDSRGSSWYDGHLEEKKKTFSVPGLLFSLGKPDKFSTIDRTPTVANRTRSMVSATLSRSSSACSDTLHASSICGLNACVGGVRNKNSPLRRRYSVGPDNSNSDECSHNNNDNSINNSIAVSYSDTDRERPHNSDTYHSNCGWPHSSSVPERMICDPDEEIQCMDLTRPSIADSCKATKKQSERRISSSPSAKMGPDQSEVNGNGCINQNFKGEMKQICQTITSL
ncbi:guanylate cyclase [Plakobranchus ocellatus]|uniref:receptor protein-tyrosine kinase n=1 Tax=Plakobranchus ocellatus TaxID=259542 RepID=A0AAV3ZA48_9GAST|nr:guanylate cyclase [Plakobranchus ocellatus]